MKRVARCRCCSSLARRWRGLHGRTGFPRAGSARRSIATCRVRSRTRSARRGSCPIATFRPSGGRCSARPRSTRWCGARSPQSPTLDQARARLVAGAGAADRARRRHRSIRRSTRRSAPCGSASTRRRSAFRRRPIPGPFNVFSLGADVSYNFDLFGGTRRELEALAAEVDYQGYELEAARLTLATNVVTTAIRQAALAAQIESTAGDPRRADGGSSRSSSSGTRRAASPGSTCRTSARWSRRPRRRCRRCARSGRRPATCSRSTWAIRRRTRRSRRSASPTCGCRPNCRCALPSELVRQRPDIRASEALLHKASANVGVATADLYPKLRDFGRFFVEPAQYFGRVSATASTSGTSAPTCCSRCSAAASCRRASGPPMRPTSRPRRRTGSRCCRDCRTSPTCCARSRPTTRRSPPGPSRRPAPTMPTGSRSAASTRAA